MNQPPLVNECLSLERPWRFAILSGDAATMKDALMRDCELHEIDGRATSCMRTFHAEVAADFFFASHYNCDPNAPLALLDAPLAGNQVTVWWDHADAMLTRAPDDWEAVVRMFRAAMVTLYSTGTYLRLVFASENPTVLEKHLQALADSSDAIAGVGFDYEMGQSQFDVLHESRARPRMQPYL